MKREPGYVPTTLEMFTSIARRTLLAYLVLAVVGAGAAAIVASSGAVWGILLGIGLAGGAMGLTLLVMMVTEKVGGVNDMAIMLGSYLLKMVVLFVVFVAISDSTFFDKSAVLLGFASAVIVSLIVDTVTIARTRA